MHGGPVLLAGPLWWVAVAFFGVAWLLAAYVVFDSLRSVRAERLAELPESRLVYLLPSAAFIVLTLVTQFAGVPLLGLISVISAPFVIGLALAYLLRVVFPARLPDEAEGEQPDARSELERPDAEAEHSEAAGEAGRTPRE